MRIIDSTWILYIIEACNLIADITNAIRKPMPLGLRVA